MKEIHYLGPQGTFTEIATRQFLEKSDLKDSDVKLVPCKSIADVINNVDTPGNIVGVVPVENSTEGIVRETLDTLVKASSKVMICSETVVRISQCLVSKAKRYEDIKTIISHTQGLAQCQDFIARYLPANIEQVTARSTSEAIQSLLERDASAAAIGTKLAAEHYALPVLAENINDQKENYTKFVMLCNETPDPTGTDVTSIAVAVRNKPGALVDLLVPFSKNNINLKRIESRPSKKILGDYLFFIDFEGHIQEEKVKQTMGQVIPIIDSYRFLGSYPRHQEST